MCSGRSRFTSAARRARSGLHDVNKPKNPAHARTDAPHVLHRLHEDGLVARNRVYEVAPKPASSRRGCSGVYRIERRRPATQRASDRTSPDLGDVRSPGILEEDGEERHESPLGPGRRATPDDDPRGAAAPPAVHSRVPDTSTRAQPPPACGSPPRTRPRAPQGPSARRRCGVLPRPLGRGLDLGLDDAGCLLEPGRDRVRSRRVAPWINCHGSGFLLRPIPRGRRHRARC